MASRLLQFLALVTKHPTTTSFVTRRRQMPSHWYVGAFCHLWAVR